jgi:hypothetical protein
MDDTTDAFAPSKCDQKTTLDWRSWNVQKRPGDRADQRPNNGDPAQGFKAVEMCSNGGHCRKLTPGPCAPATA